MIEKSTSLRLSTVKALNNAVGKGEAKTFSELARRILEAWEDQQKPPEPELEPFDIERAKRGDAVVFNNGDPSRVIATDLAGPLPVVATASDHGREYAVSFTDEGKDDHIDDCVNRWLMHPAKPKVKREGWVNVWDSAVAPGYEAGESVHDTPEAAKRYATPKCRQARITWEESQ